MGFCSDELEGACSQNEKIIRHVITHGPLGLPWIISQRECGSNARANVLLRECSCAILCGSSSVPHPSCAPSVLSSTWPSQICLFHVCLFSRFAVNRRIITFVTMVTGNGCSKMAVVKGV